MTNITYKPGEHPSLPPPKNSVGWVDWVYKNLCSTWYDALFTIIFIIFMAKYLPPMVQWLFLDATLFVSSQRECYEAGEGACWAFARARWGLYIYNVYPVDQRWRVDVAFVLLFVALAPLLYDNIKYRKQLLIFSAIYPFLAYILIKGGIIFPKIDTDKLGGMMLNLIVGVVGIAASLPLGILLALGRRSKLIVVKYLSIWFIEFIRGVPLITLLFVASNMLNYFLPPGVRFDLLLRVMIMVSLFSAAYLAEVIRGGLQAIPKGQMEAAEAMGLTYWQAMRLVILPQALKISIPGIVNSFIGLFKDTTLVIIISMFDILGVGRATLQDANWKGISREVYMFIGLFFFVVCFAMSRYSLYLENKLKTDHKK